MICMESFVATNSKPCSYQSVLFTYSWMIHSIIFCPTNIRSIDLYYRYIFGLWSVLHVDIYFQQVLRSELYLCLYSILAGYPCLAPVHPPPLSPWIHILKECLVLLVGGNNVFKLGYTWQNVAMIQSQLIT